MKKYAYYNDHDPHAAEWLRNLISAGFIPDGDVDERDVEDVKPVDLMGYTQCHFFAGIGGWSLALRLAGWPENKPVWTGSCPCQPFSAAGKGKGFADERHLWPAWFHFIEQCRPPVIFGEQVEAAIRHGWLDLVQADLEGIGYAVGSADICAAGVGAPHIRQRLWFVGHALDTGLEGYSGHGDEAQGWKEQVRPVAEASGSGGMADSKKRGFAGWSGAGREDRQETIHDIYVGDDRPGPVNDFWRDADWLYCRDGKWRPVESGSFPLVDGLPFRLADGRTRDGTSRKNILKGLGNAIVPAVAVEFIKAFLMDVENRSVHA